MRLPHRLRIVQEPASLQGFCHFSDPYLLSLAEFLSPTAAVRGASGARRLRRPTQRWSRRDRQPRRSANGPMIFRQKGRMMEAQSSERPGIRQELVARVRREIDDGAYDTLAKLEVALERLLIQMDHD